MPLGRNEMYRRTVTGLLLAVLVIWLSMPIFEAHPVLADGTIYIRADGSVDPPSAPISTVDNVTYTFTANIYDEIVVQRSNITVNGADYTLQGSGTGDGLYLYEVDNVEITRTKIDGFFDGICARHSCSNRIHENNLTNNQYGIYLYYSSQNQVAGNDLENNYCGITIDWSEDNFLRNNTMVANRHSFGFGGYWLAHFVHDVDASNTVDGKPIYYWVNHQNDFVPADAGYVGIVNSSDITVQNLSLKNNLQGILFAYTENSAIITNNITNNRHGIKLHASSNIIVSGNNMKDNSYQGLDMVISSNSTLRNNDINSSMWNFGVSGRGLTHFVHDVDASNTVDGKPIYYWVNHQNDFVPADAGYVGIVNSSDITVQNLSLKNNLQGILFAYTENSAIITNNITNNQRGIYLRHSPKNSISGNSIEDNFDAIWLPYSSNNNISANSIASNNCGIVCDESSNNTIYGNIIAANYWEGLWLPYCSNYEIFGNKIEDNKWGFHFYSSSNNSIYENNISRNECGILFEYSSNNLVIHNDFINNTEPVCSFSSNNTWDKGYPSGGNYWSDYVDVDLFGGPNQDVLGSDGMWDHPYVIDEDNQDWYPLVNPWAPPLEWNVVLTASLADYYDVSDFGVRSDATDGFDPAYDQIDPPEPPVGVVSYFQYPNNPPLYQKLSVSKIPLSTCMTWPYTVETRGIAGSICITWDLAEIAEIPPAYAVLLCTPEERIDMREVTDYCFPSGELTKYPYAIEVVLRCDFELQLSTGWNMISLPCLPADPSFSNIFSEVAYYQVLTWDGASYVDVSAGDAEPGWGYWVLVLEDTNVTVTNGIPVESYERDLDTGWSMIGSITCTVDSDCVFPDYYQLLTWDGTSYVDAAPIGIEPRKGYWALVLESTHIAVNQTCCVLSSIVSNSVRVASHGSQFQPIVSTTTSLMEVILVFAWVLAAFPHHRILARCHCSR